MCINPLQDGIKLAAVKHHEALHAGKEDPGLAILYPHPRLWPIWLVVGAALPIIATTVMVILKAKKIPYLAVGWLWYVGTLVPVIRLVQVSMQTRADRYTYIPLIGLFIIVAWGFPEIISEWRYRKEALVGLAALSLLCLFAVTWNQLGYWQNNLSLFNHTLKVTKQNYIFSLSVISLRSISASSYSGYFSKSAFNTLTASSLSPFRFR